ncbi:MAG: ABC transporter permease [Firmicutes bacterium]|nr:ABC transporter permease [Bacillota bacterium]
MFARPKEIIEYRSMLWGLILSELRTRYRGSVLGFLWTFVNPLLTLLVYTLVFSTVMRIHLTHYAVFLFIGLLGWNMFSGATLSATSVIVRQAPMVKKIYFPREILPLSVVGGALMNYLFSLVILIPFLLLSGYEPNVYWLYLPLIILIETILTSGFALLFASVNVYMRDLEHVLQIFMMLWMYLTPVVYTLSMVPQRFLPIFMLNPVTDVISSYQDIFYYEHSLDWKGFLYGTVVSVVILLIGWSVFHRLSRRFAEEV